MAKVTFEDYSIEIKGILDSKVNAVLEECAGEIESQTKQNCRVDTGQTKNAWTHYVDDSKHTAYIGNPLENSIWEEFGTGEYALNGNGRKGGWSYQDAQGKWHHTYGKTPTRAFWHAFNSLKGSIVSHIQNSMRF